VTHDATKTNNDAKKDDAAVPGPGRGKSNRFGDATGCPAGWPQALAGRR